MNQKQLLSLLTSATIVAGVAMPVMAAETRSVAATFSDYGRADNDFRLLDANFQPQELTLEEYLAKKGDIDQTSFEVTSEMLNENDFRVKEFTITYKYYTRVQSDLGYKQIENKETIKIRNYIVRELEHVSITSEEEVDRMKKELEEYSAAKVVIAQVRDEMLESEALPGDQLGTQEATPGFGPNGDVTPGLDANSDIMPTDVDVEGTPSFGFGPDGDVTPGLNTDEIPEVGVPAVPGTPDGGDVMPTPDSKAVYAPQYTITTEVDNKTGVTTVTVSENVGHIWRYTAPNKELSGLEVVNAEDVRVYTVALPGASINEFLNNIYVIGLQRDADKEGFNYWAERLATQQTGGREILVNLLNSDEFKAVDMDPERFVNAMYSIVLGRTPDEGGSYYWLELYSQVIEEKGGDVGETRMHVLDSMLRGNLEFEARCENMGIRY